MQIHDRFLLYQKANHVEIYESSTNAYQITSTFNKLV